MFSSHRITRTRSVAAAVAALAAATVVPCVVSDAAAASTASKPAAGIIHLYFVNTNIESNGPGDVLISGAFADHGTITTDILHLRKGTITVNLAKYHAVVGSPKFATSYAASCSFSGVGNLSLPLVSGTGAYVGVKGTIKAQVIFGAENPFKAGKCDPNLPPIADQELITGSGRVTF